MPTHFLYRHIRKDLNIPFYIGVGQKRPRYSELNIEKKYERAYMRRDRNSYWQEIVNNTEFEVEIMMESDDREFMFQKEIEFIALYGRLCNNTGSLANIEPGGKCKTLERQSRLKLAKPVFVYTVKGEFVKKYDILRDAERELGLSMHIVCSALKGNSKRMSNGYHFFNEYKGENIPPINYEKNGGRPILIFDSISGQMIGEISTLTEFRNKFHKSQRKAYRILEGKETLDGKRYIFKDLYNGPTSSI